MGLVKFCVTVSILTVMAAANERAIIFPGCITWKTGFTIMIAAVWWKM